MMLQVAVLFALALSAAAQSSPAAIVVHPPASSSIIATQSIKLVCVAYGYPTPAFVNWTATNGNDLQTLASNPDGSGPTVTITQDTVTGDGVEMRVSILEICNIDTTFTGNYTCAASNGVAGDGIAPSWATSTLSVTDPLTMPPAIVVHPPPNNTVDEMSTVEFGCVAYGNPIPSIYWSRPGCSDIKNSSVENLFVYTSMVTANGVTMRKSVLQICDVDRGDEYQYSCWAENGVTVGKWLADSSYSFNVAVYVPTTAPPTTRSSGTTQPTQGDRTAAPTCPMGLVNENTIPYLSVVIVLVLVVIVLVLLLIVTVVYAMKMKKIIKNKTGYSISMGAINPAGEGYEVHVPDTQNLVGEDAKQDLAGDGDDGTDPVF